MLYLSTQHCRKFLWVIQHEGVCQEINTARGEAEYCIYLERPLSAVFLVQTS